MNIIYLYNDAMKILENAYFYIYARELMGEAMIFIIIVCCKLIPSND